MTAEVLITLAAGFGAGALLIALGSRTRRFAGVSELWAIYRTEILIVGAVLVPALDEWAFTAALIALSVRGQREIFHLFNVAPRAGTIAVAAIAAGALVLSGILGIGTVLWQSLATGTAATIIAVLAFEPRTAWRRLQAVAAFSLVFPALFAAFGGALRWSEGGFAWIVLAYATVEIADAFALLCGKLFGRTKILPTLSPRKTAEGLSAGLLAGAAAGAAIGHYAMGLSWIATAGTVGAILAAGLAGDLATSALKRWQKKKDFLPVMRLHGGVLDIYDSALFAAPVALLCRDLASG